MKVCLRFGDDREGKTVTWVLIGYFIVSRQSVAAIKLGKMLVPKLQRL